MLNNAGITILLCTVLIAFQACDAFYIVRGTVTELYQEKSSEQHANTVLDNVDVRLLCYTDDKGSTRSIVNGNIKTNKEGRYNIFFIWSPFSFSNEVFLDFEKPGYLKKKIFVSDDNKDSDATIKRCPEKKPYQGCWVIDVRLTPEIGQKNEVR